ncbi:MAG: glycoside hydrolase family 5 protein [Prevotella sp.]|nr:glycoside hydrolase family 5 protein [Prevotella sp.]
MKRLLLTLSVCAFCFTLSLAQTKPVKQWGQLQVRGAQLCDQQGNPVVLRGVSFGWHNIWPRFYNKKAVRTLHRDWNATVVRAAMGVTTVEDNYLENPTFALQCVEPVIKAAIKEGIYVIIDWHAHEMHTQKAKEFFSKMAQKYGRYPNIIYELYNEPVEDSWESLKQYASEIITEIRRYDPDNIILMGCPHWDQDIHLVAESPLTGVYNVMYTLHFYASTHKEYLRDRMEEAAKKGLPIFVSESGVTEASGNGKIDPESQQLWLDRMEKLKISWVCWSLSDKDESCSMLLPRATATGPWADDVIKRSGKLTKGYLLKYNK